MKHLTLAAVPAAFLLMGTLPAHANPTPHATATVTSPADGATFTAVNNPDPAPPTANVSFSSSHTVSISGATSGQTFAVQYSCQLRANTADVVPIYLKPPAGDPVGYFIATADAMGNWSEPKTLSGSKNMTVKVSPNYHTASAYTQITTTTIGSASSPTASNKFYVNPPPP